jgi:hypothetical protein
MYNKFLAIVVSSFCVFSFLSVQRGYGTISCAGERQKLEDLLAQRDDATKSEDDRDILDKKIATQFGVVDKICPKSYSGTATMLAGMTLVDVGLLGAVKNILDIFNHPVFLGQDAQALHRQPQFPLSRGKVLALCGGICVVIDVLIWFIP